MKVEYSAEQNLSEHQLFKLQFEIFRSVWNVPHNFQEQMFWLKCVVTNYRRNWSFLGYQFCGAPLHPCGTLGRASDIA